MSVSKKLSTTVLHPFHLERNAHMAEFGGYDMPLWYSSGTKAEHLAVISQAGLFDTSHMAVIIVEGSDAFDLLQHSFTRDLRYCQGRSVGPLSDGRSVYGLFLHSDGTVLDDAIISRCGAERYMIVVNSGMGAGVCNHLRELSDGKVNLVDYTDELGKIDLQGPASAAILQKLLSDPEQVLADMHYFSFRGDIFAGGSESLELKDGIKVIVSRTGYTGEFGFELFSAKVDARDLWNKLLDAGQSYGLLPCGLAARDSLRAGAMLPLSHQDIGNWLFGHTPWSFVLPWDPDGQRWTKSFVGSQQLLQGDRDYTYGFAGYDPRKIQVGEASEVQDISGRRFGRILTCTTDMAIGRVEDQIVSIATPTSRGRPDSFQARGLSCGFVRVDRPCEPGEQIFLVEGKRKLKVEIRKDIRPDRTARAPMARMRLS
ncbi:MAG: aminomethyl transferase family protein [Desulfofustis sp.]|nr:aminomethyl transferase family protein [Desulfofustis sp.]